MEPERWLLIEALFQTACDKPADQRPAFLAETCTGDPMLRAEVESLLANLERASGFLESATPATAPTFAADLLSPGERIGPYTVAELLGAGGMGQVYKAYDQRLDRHVALKFLPSIAGDAEAWQRFEREARAASALNHPNICTVHDVGEFQGRPYLVMELLEGQSLKERIAAQPLPPAEFFTVSRQVCAALEAAHAMGITHRDIKPANIFVTRDGRVKILDFGLAKRAAEGRSASGCEQRLSDATRTMSLTATGAIVGTLAYMSPEQALGQTVDARSDIFSLGVVLYEMATGQAPFRAKTAAGLLGLILSGSPAKPSAVHPAVPAAWDGVILKALEKDRESRYQSVSSLAADLDRWRQADSGEGALRTRRWMLAATAAGTASLAGGAFLARRLLLPGERKIRLAVLPFENMGGDPREAFFADGLHQDMISVLNRLYPDRLGVIARTSVKRYQATAVSVQQVGRDLHVDYVVEGGVQRDGGRAHITARLIRVSDQTSLWNTTYERDLGQVMAVQTEIARAIAHGIGSRLRPDTQVSAALARPLDAGAHEAYLRGDFARAVQLDPSYAAAFTGLAGTAYYPGLFGMEAPRQAFRRMMDAAARALQLDATQAGAHAALALGKLHLEWNWREAEAGLRRALRLNPGDGEVRHFLGHYLLWSGQGDEAARECRRGLEVDPYNPDLIACIGWHELCAGHENTALEETRRALALDPKHGWALLTLGWIYERRGMFQEALSALRGAWDFPLKTASLGHAFARSGNRRTAEKILSDLLAQSEKRYISAYDLAVVCIGLEERERAFEWLNRAYDEHAGFLLFANSDPHFKAIRPDPRFRALLRRMRFPKAEA